jgi:hypothetical protein
MRSPRGTSAASSSSDNDARHTPTTGVAQIARTHRRAMYTGSGQVAFYQALNWNAS